MLKVKNIRKSYENELILNNVSFNLNKKEKKAIIGPNGSGKSTLLKIIAGIETADTGTIENDQKSIAYLNQELIIPKNTKQNILEYLKDILGIDEIEQQMQKLENNLDDQNNLLEYSKLQEKYSLLDAYNLKHNALKILSGFSLDTKIQTKLENLSGGEKNKLAFTALLLKNTDILLLDEPTNNLDLKSIIWLENFIKNTKQACLIISHDREFLDKTVTHIIQIRTEDKSILEEAGNYTDFIQRRENEKEKQKLQYNLNQEKIEKIKIDIKNKKQWAEKGKKQIMPDNEKYGRGSKRDRAAKLTKNTKQKEKQIKRLTDAIDKPLEDKKIITKFNTKYNNSKANIVMHDLKIGYKNDFSLEPFSLQINFGQKIAIIGDNASGKTTFMKTMLGLIEPLSGDLKISPSIKIGNFMQNHENLNPEENIYNYIKKQSNLNEQECHQILRNFNFKFENRTKKIKQLSPGERARLILAGFTAQEINTLILDEPTNHLDMETIDALENILSNYKGTIILVSHDRYFIKKIATDSIYIISDHKIKEIINYDDYLNKLENNL